MKTLCPQTATCPIPEPGTFKKQVWARNLERVIWTLQCSCRAAFGVRSRDIQYITTNALLRE